MLQSDYLSVMNAKNKDEFRRELLRFANRLGFEKMSAMLVIDHVLGSPEFVTVDNLPAALEERGSNLEVCRRDPVTQHCRFKSLPIVWSQATHVASGTADLWEEQARFGYRCGIAMALHLAGGRHFMLSVDRDQDVPNDPAELTRMVADLQLLAVHAYEAANQILVPVAPAPLVNLTAREKEAMKWTMEGKTAWEVGNILGISERTAVLHVNNAMHKLDCVNKHQAVLKALRMGLLT